MKRESRLLAVFMLNAALIVGLVGVGVGAHSIGVLAAAGDYLADAFAIGLSLFTVRLSKRPPTARRSFGFHRSTILAAQVNASLILTATLLIGFEAIRRLVVGTGPVQGRPVVIVSGVAAIVMLGCALMLRETDADKIDLNMRSVLLDTAADAVTAAGVATAGGIILVTGKFHWLDPGVALIIGVIIGYRALRLLSEIGDVLLESTPQGLDIAAVDAAIREDGKIEDVHDLHVWGLTADMPLLSAHVVLSGHPTLEEAQAAVERAKGRLIARFGIDHATLEMECEPCASPDLHSVREC